jgi:hypothetical protein
MRALKGLIALVVSVTVLATLGVSSALALPSEPVHQACGDGGCWAFHAWAESTCGCTSTGTGWLGTTPLHWAVPKDQFDQDAMDEAAWLINTSNTNESTETGYVSGWWPYSLPARTWLSGLRAYGTEENGANGLMSSPWLSANTATSAYSYGSGADSQVDQNGVLFWDHTTWPSIPAGVFNFVQGEVHATNCDGEGDNCSPYGWLNNCSPGEEFTLEYAASGSWHDWTSLTTDDFYPYWSDYVNADHYTNGGGLGYGCP